jgi:hypothetical protein
MNSRLVHLLPERAVHQLTLNVQVILKEFSQLLEDYQVLKKKALESKDERQDGVQIVNQAIRKPYVLMLVDGNNYIVCAFLFAYDSANTTCSSQMIS